MCGPASLDYESELGELEGGPFVGAEHKLAGQRHFGC